MFFSFSPPTPITSFIYSVARILFIKRCVSCFPVSDLQCNKILKFVTFDQFNFLFTVYHFYLIPFFITLHLWLWKMRWNIFYFYITLPMYNCLLCIYCIPNFWKIFCWRVSVLNCKKNWQKKKNVHFSPFSRFGGLDFGKFPISS